MRTKALFQSRTATFNFVVSVLAVIAFFWPPANEFATTHAAAILGVIGMINIGLRRVTKSAWTLFPAILAMCVFLPSCAGEYASTRIGYFKETTAVDPEGEFGVLSSVNPSALVGRAVIATK